jgi:cytochrome b
MEKGKPIRRDEGRAVQPVRVWDLPTRLFHWLLAVLVAVSFITAAMGGNAMQYHERSGYTILTLLVFRMAWGFVGGRESRFTSFVRGPKAVVRYAASLLRRSAAPHLGHNPLGGWSVIAMLVTLFIQAGTGLFANDDIVTQGALYSLVNDQTSHMLTGIHKFNQEILLLLVAIHICAIFFYLFHKNENLIKPMVTGVKQWVGDAVEPDVDHAWLAAAIAALSAVAVYLLVHSGTP